MPNRPKRDKRTAERLRETARNGTAKPRILTKEEIDDLNKGIEPGAPRPIITTLSTVQARPIEWLWDSWIPYRALTLLDGDPGLGKSTAALDISARLSRGWHMPPDSGTDANRQPADVLLLSAEDAVAETIRPRLDAADADVKRIHILEAVRTGDEQRPPVLPWDLSLVETTIKAKGIRLVIVDPLMTYLDGELDAHRDQDVRRCLYQLKCLAEKMGIAILLIRHLNKLIGGPAMYRGGGSIGITGAVRSALIVGKNPNDPHQIGLAPVKCNLAVRPKAIAYELEAVGQVARVGWIGEVDLLADDILGHAGGTAKRTKTDSCAEEIRGLLGTGPMESDALEKALLNAGYSEWTIKAARRRLGVKSWRDGYGKDGRWMVSLPNGEESGAADAGPTPF